MATSAKTGRLGANAIVGFSLDYDNIGSKQKSLLMASATATAVVIEQASSLNDPTQTRQ